MTAPVLTDLDAPTFGENLVNATPQLIDSDVTLTDPEGDFDGGKLTVSGLLAEDRVSIRTEGLVSFNSGTGEVSYNGVVIGIASGGVGAAFKVTFDADATTASVEAVIEHLTYANVSDTPTATRDLSITVTDGAGGGAAFSGSGAYLVDADGLSLGAAYTDPTLVDLDNDGDLDLVVGSFMDATALYYENTGTAQAPVFEARTGADNPFTAFDSGSSLVTNFTLVDLDGDGDKDAFYSDGYAPAPVFLENTGDAEHPVFAVGANPLTAISASYPALAFGDFDGDGDQDLVWTGFFSGTHYMENVGTASAPSFVERTGAANPLDGVSFSFADQAAAGDVDNDGDLDLMIGGADGSLHYLENTGTALAPVFTNQGVIASLGGGNYANPALGDLDNDGDLDLILGGGNASDTRYFANALIQAGPSVTVTVTAQPEPISGGGGSQTMPGTTGDDYFNGDAGNDVLKGGLGNDTLDGGADNDKLEGGDGDDTLIGGSGDDTLNGGPGADHLAGGAGDDLYIVDGDDTATENGGEGIDTVQAGASWTLGDNFENLTLTGTDDLSGIGNDENNVIIGNKGDNYLSGLGGDDTLIGNNGDDTLSGGDDDDTLTGGAGDDVLDGGDGADSMAGGAGNDTYWVQAGDRISEAGANGIDTIITDIDGYVIPAGFENLSMFKGKHEQNATGNSAANVMYGSGGVNHLDGQAGADQLYGLEGNDFLVGGVGNDLLDGGEGADDMRGGVGQDIYVVDDAHDLVVENFNEGIDTIRTRITLKMVANVENLELLGDDDIGATGNTLNNHMTGNEGANTLSGGTGNDTLLGGDGDDALLGGAGNDVLDGGEGEDTLTGGAGNDLYLVGAGDLVIEVGSGGVDTVRTALDGYTLTDGVETLELLGAGDLGGYGNAMANILRGNDGANHLGGGAGNDQLFGALGDDVLIGGAGADKLDGGDGGDYLYGEEGADTLTGGDGDDWFYGGTGNDSFTGGAGADHFIISDGDMNLSSRGGVKQTDTIVDLDFSQGDRIDLSGVDADVTQDGWQAFHFVSNFTKSAGEARLTYTASSNVTTLMLDVDGDGKADYQLNIRGDATHGDILGPDACASDGGWFLGGYIS